MKQTCTPEFLTRLQNLFPHDAVQGLAVSKLHGDASNRTYFRIQTPTQSFILMERSVTGNESASEEVSNARMKILEYPFLNIQRYLQSQSIRVPKIFASSEKKDLILLEDLGDFTLEKKIQKTPGELRSLYQQALDMLVQLQSLNQTGSKDCVAWQRSFDRDLLEWEFEHFIEWGLERSLPLTLPKHEGTQMRSLFRDMVSELLTLPQVFCHRDFQSRNLMFAEDGVVLLDFQDALRGPKPYDLVALLRDSYIELSEKDLTYLQNSYLEKSAEKNGNKFLADFDLQTIQRKLKDGGRFHYIHLYKGNPDFLPHVPASYRYVARALTRRKEGKYLLPILGRYLKEFAS